MWPKLLLPRKAIGHRVVPGTMVEPSTQRFFSLSRIENNKFVTSASIVMAFGMMVINAQSTKSTRFYFILYFVFDVPSPRCTQTTISASPFGKNQAVNTSIVTPYCKSTEARIETVWTFFFEIDRHKPLWPPMYIAHSISVCRGGVCVHARAPHFAASTLHNVVRCVPPRSYNVCIFHPKCLCFTN